MENSVEIDGNSWKLMEISKYGSSDPPSVTRRVKRTKDSLGLLDRHPTRHSLGGELTRGFLGLINSSFRHENCQKKPLHASEVFCQYILRHRSVMSRNTRRRARAWANNTEQQQT